MFKNIMVCLDGSKLAEQIIPFAITEATNCTANKVTLLQVVHIPTASMPAKLQPAYTKEAQENVQFTVEREKSEARDYLEQVAKTMRTKGLYVECVVIEGKPGESIVKYAGKNEVELIMIATHGRGGLSRIAFGSVAEQVLRESGMPVLLIRSK